MAPAGLGRYNIQRGALGAFVHFVLDHGGMGGMLRGRRVCLRPLGPGDLTGDAGWSRLSPELLQERCRRALADPRQGVFVVLNEAGQRIGRTEYVGLDEEEGFVYCNVYLSEPFTGRGYGSEALRLLIEWLFESYRIREVRCVVIAGNDRSLRFCRRNGLRWVGEERGRHLFVLSRSDWERQKCSKRTGS